MKQIVISIIFIISALFSFGQSAQGTQPGGMPPVDADSKLILYRDVITEQGNVDILYNRGMGWFSTYYKNAGGILKTQDKVNGKLAGTAKVMVSYFDEKGMRMDGGAVLYDISLELKENKYRYSITNFTLKTTSRYPIEKWMNKSDPAYNSNWDSYLYQVDTTMRSLVKNLKEGMKPKTVKKDDW